MIDALGAPQSVLVLGANSDIAKATVTRLAASGRLNRVVLAGRDVAALAAEATRVSELGVARVQTVPFDAADPSTHEDLLIPIFAGGDIDVVLVAFGVLPDQAQSLADPSVALAVARVNYLGAMSVLLHSATALRAQGHGVLVVLSSVAGERPRRSNFVYGSTKAAIDALATGLGDELVGSGVSVLVVRPGFVHTKMTAGMAKVPLSTTPEVVAEAIATNLTRGTRTVWVPGVFRYVMSILRHLPRPVFRRLPM